MVSTLRPAPRAAGRPRRRPRPRPGLRATAASALGRAVAVAVVAAAAVSAGCVQAELEGRRCGGDDDCVDGYRCVQETCLRDEQNPPAAALLSDDCADLVGEGALGALSPAQAEDATKVALIGLLLPLTRAGEPFATGAARAEAVALGLSAVNRDGGFFGREIAAVRCNSDGDVETAKRAAGHLASLGIPLVVGEQTSSTTLQVFADVLRPAGVMMIAPSATSVDLTTLPDDGLLARTTVSDARQAAVLGRELVAGTRAAVVAVRDSYGDTLLEGARQVLCADASRCRNDAAHVEARFPPTATDDEVDDAVARVVAIDPQFVGLIGQANQVRPFLEKLGAALPAAVFVLTDAARNEQLFTSPTPLATAVVDRVRGTAPLQAPVGVAFDQVRLDLSDEARDASFVAHAYDAAVVAGLLHAAAGRAPHPRGTTLAPLLSRLVAAGPVVSVVQDNVAAGGAGVGQALAALSAGDVVDVDGTSGPLDFDAHGDVSGDIELWRRCPRGDGAVIVSLGVALTADGQRRTPTTTCTCALPELACADDQVCNLDTGACEDR